MVKGGVLRTRVAHLQQKSAFMTTGEMDGSCLVLREKLDGLYGILQKV